MPRITNKSVRPITVNERTGENADGHGLHRPVVINPGQTSDDIELHDPNHPVYKGLEQSGELAYDLGDEEVARWQQAALNPFTPQTQDNLLVGAREVRWTGAAGPAAPEPQPNSLRTPAAAAGPGPLSAAPQGQGGRPPHPPELAEPAPRQPAQAASKPPAQPPAPPVPPQPVRQPPAPPPATEAKSS